MSEFKIETYKPGSHGDLEHLCAETQEEDVQMLPLNPDRIATQTERFVAVRFEARQVVGYCAQIATYPGAIAEVGSLIVDAPFRRHGLARQLVVAVTNAIKARTFMPIAFCNPTSQGVFEKVGYEPLPVSDIPPLALELCQACPKQPAGGGCCDKAYIYNEGETV